MDKTSLELLNKFHFSENEAAVYLALLELGIAAASDVARHTNIPRPTAYMTLESLTENGYVSSLPNTKIKHYQATDPYALLVELENSAHDFREMLPYLRSKQKQAGKPNIAYYTGEKGARVAFAQIRKPRDAYYATSVEQVKQYLPQEFQRWCELYNHKNVRPGAKHLLLDSDDSRKFAKILGYSGQEVKYLENNMFWDMDLVLFDGKVIMTSFEGEINVTMIESPGLFSSLKQLYLLAWQSAKL